MQSPVFEENIAQENQDFAACFLFPACGWVHPVFASVTPLLLNDLLKISCQRSLWSIYVCGIIRVGDAGGCVTGKINAGIQKNKRQLMDITTAAAVQDPGL